MVWFIDYLLDYIIYTILFFTKHNTTWSGSIYSLLYYIIYTILFFTKHNTTWSSL